MLGLMGGLGLIALVGCGDDDDAAGSGTSSSSTSTTTAAGSSSTTAATSGGGSTDCVTIPEETAGPYPGDGSNGPNMLTQDGVVRKDIRSSIGSGSAIAEGVLLTIDLTVLDSSGSCAAVEGAAVYL
jgi:protocatechuate 3,4-dioxygenase beta subunit